MFGEARVMASKTTGPTPPQTAKPQSGGMPEVNRVTADDIAASLKAGFSDFLARPLMSGFFGLLRLKIEVQHPRPAGRRMLRWTDEASTSAARNVA
jgi:hypothetical protein